MNLRKFLVALTVAMVIVLAAVMWLVPTNEDFRTDNPFWNGTREVTFNHSFSPLETLSSLPSSPGGSTLILIPYLQFSPAELEIVRNFIIQGGTLVLADDYGYGNQVLAYLGFRTRFSGQALLDPLISYKTEWFPQISRFKSNPLTGNIDNLVLNHATSLVNIEAADVLASSSSFSFLDLNGNQIREESEPTGPLPVIAQHNLGSGQVILIADPSLFINGMETLGDNYKFIQNIAALTASDILIDHSHLPPSNLHQTKNLLASIRGALITPLGTLGMVVLVLAITLMPLWHERR